jgi:hypothetical protein
MRPSDDSLPDPHDYAASVRALLDARLDWQARLAAGAGWRATPGSSSSSLHPAAAEALLAVGVNPVVDVILSALVSRGVAPGHKLEAAKLLAGERLLPSQRRSSHPWHVHLLHHNLALGHTCITLCSMAPCGMLCSSYPMLERLQNPTNPTQQAVGQLLLQQPDSPAPAIVAAATAAAQRGTGPAKFFLARWLHHLQPPTTLPIPPPSSLLPATHPPRCGHRPPVPAAGGPRCPGGAAAAHSGGRGPRGGRWHTGGSSALPVAAGQPLRLLRRGEGDKQEEGGVVECGMWQHGLPAELSFLTA